MALHARPEERARPWPWLAGLCYRALEPLGVAFPEDDRAAVVAGKALAGRPVRPDRVAAAARASGPGPGAPAHAPDPALAASVDRFWSQLAAVAERLGTAVRAAEHDTVERVLRAARTELRQAARSVHAAAQASPSAAPQPRGEPAPDDEPEVVRIRGSAPARSDPPSRPDRRATPAPPPPAAAAPPAAPPPEVDERPVVADDQQTLGPERPFAPLIFAGVAVLISLLLLGGVATGLLHFG